MPLALPISARAAAADDALVARGAYLAKAGDCVACHSAPKGKPFAGGLPMTTPMGRIYTTNITPDPDTGIGKWSEEDFEKALRQGVAKDGHNLYPAMPYPSYAKVRDDDVKALYAYFMKGVAPVNQAEPRIRHSVSAEHALAAEALERWCSSIKASIRTRAARMSRGIAARTSIQGLGHCGSCHTARGIAFQEKALDESGSAYLTGGVLDGWFASNLTGEHNVGLGRWSEADVIAVPEDRGERACIGIRLDDGRDQQQHAGDERRGRRCDVALSEVAACRRRHECAALCLRSEGDEGVCSRTPPTMPARRSIRRTACIATAWTARAYAPLLAPLAGNPNVMEKDASSLINVTLNGTQDLVIQGIPAAYPMPKYSPVLNDQQIADVLTFIRAGWNNGAPAVAALDVAKLRKSTQAAK